MYEYRHQRSMVEKRSRPRETVTFIHFSDAHLDLSYLPGSTADCGMHLCCRQESESGKGSVKAGYWGAEPNSDNSCDIPQWTL